MRELDRLKLYRARSRLYRSQILQVNTKYSLESSRRDLHNALLRTVFGIPIRKARPKKTWPKHALSKLNFFIKNLQLFCQNFRKFSRILPEFSRDFCELSGGTKEVPRRYSGIGTSSAGRCIWPIHPLLAHAAPRHGLPFPAQPRDLAIRAVHGAPNVILLAGHL